MVLVAIKISKREEKCEIKLSISFIEVEPSASKKKIYSPTASNIPFLMAAPFPKFTGSFKILYLPDSFSLSKDSTMMTVASLLPSSTITISYEKSFFRTYSITLERNE